MFAAFFLLVIPALSVSALTTDSESSKSFY